MRTWVSSALLGLLLLASAGGAAQAKGFIDWDTWVVAQTVDPILDLASSGATIAAGYYIGDVADQMGRVFGGAMGATGYGAQGFLSLPFDTLDGSLSFSLYAMDEMIIDWPVGTWGATLDAAFAIQTPSLTRMSASVEALAYGLAATGVLSLSQVPGGYTTATTLGLSGTTITGLGVAATASFGSSHGEPGCSGDFQAASFTLSGFPFDCIHVDVATAFSCLGYEKTTIDFDVDWLDGILAVDGVLEFSPEQKTLTLLPSLNVEQGCIWVNVGFTPDEWGTSGDYTIDDLVIRGLGFSNVEIGTSKVSLIAAVGGTLYKSKRAGDLDLHASGYYVALAPGVSPSQYPLTDYTMVGTIAQGFLNSELIVDVYWGTPATTLFDLALITATWTYQAAPSLDVNLGFEIDPTGAAQTIVFGFSTSSLIP